MKIRLHNNSGCGVGLSLRPMILCGVMTCELNAIFSFYPSLHGLKGISMNVIHFLTSIDMVIKEGNYDQNKQISVEGGYQPSDYANLPVSMEVKELFKSIQR